MTTVHTGFLREFFGMSELVRAVPEGDRQRAGIVADHIALFAMGLHGHHEGEDAEIWPRLLERCPEEIRPLVHGMDKHHELIAAGVQELTNEIAPWRVDASVAQRDAIGRSLETFLPVLRQHLTEEIDYVLSLIEKYISDEEWDAMANHSQGTMSQDALPLIFGIMMYEGDPRSIQEALSSLPEEVRPVISEAASRAYADYAQRVYGTPSPTPWSTLSGAR